MKSTITASLLLDLITLTLLTSLPACKKSNSSPPSVTATVNSLSYTSTSVTGKYEVSNGAFVISSYMIQSHDTSILSVVLWLPFQVNVPFNSDTTLSSVNYSFDNGLTYYEAIQNERGRVIFTITSWDSAGHHIAGTLNGSVASAFSAADSIPLINGKFNTTYTDN